MRIRLAAHGGFAGGLVRPERVLDSNRLAPEEAVRLARAVATAIAESAARQPAPPPALPDAQSYTITIDDGGTPTTLTGSDADMAPGFATLLGELQRLFPR